MLINYSKHIISPFILAVVGTLLLREGILPHMYETMASCPMVCSYLIFTNSVLLLLYCLSSVKVIKNKNFVSNSTKLGASLRPYIKYENTCIKKESLAL